MAEAAGSVVARGEAALSAGDWGEARDAFATALEAGETPEALDGMGRALWWLGEVEESLAFRERAYVRLRRRREVHRAARVALWLAREYVLVSGNDSAAAGWLRRAEGMLGPLEPSPEHGWQELLRAEREEDPVPASAHARRALESARAFGDGDLEIYALGRLGTAAISQGRVDQGLQYLDEAMAAATGGEASDPQTVGDIYCELFTVAELLGDLTRFGQWSEVVEMFMRRQSHPRLLAFCRTCCGGLFVAGGDWAAAEAEYLASLEWLKSRGHRARCVDPAARLAELRVLQGRLEEAAGLVAEYEGRAEMAEASALLHLARGEAAAATVVLERRIRQVGEAHLSAAPLLSLLVEAGLAAGDLHGATRAAERLRRVAEGSRIDRISAMADLASGRVALARHDSKGLANVEGAIDSFDRLKMPLEAARARMVLAGAMAAARPDVAVAEARSARTAFERLGAFREADLAASFLRRMGVRGQTGPKSLGLLTRREQEVLRLIGYGLTNAEIGKRLFISVKTAGHHVSNVLSKLGVRSRTEAAALALRYEEEGERSTASSGLIGAK